MPSLVQVASGTVTSGNLTVTLGSPTTAGNCLVALIGSCADSGNGTISGITLGGAADNWAASATEGNGADHAISTGWADPNCAGGQTSVVISQTGGGGTVQGLLAYVLEWSGLTGTVDVSSGQSSAGFVASWTSGTTASTTQASEVAFGIVCGSSNTRGPGLTGPSAPWVNETQLVVAGTSRDKPMLCGYQILSSTGTQAYAGTASPTNTTDTLVFTLEASGTPHTATVSSTASPSTATKRGIGKALAVTVAPSAVTHRGIGKALAVTVTPATVVQVAHKRARGGGYYDYHHRAGQR